MPPEPRWLGLAVVHALQDRLIRDFGGTSGVRDERLIESALARARHKHTYGETDIPVLAAAYAFGSCRNHGYVDGNKRIGATAAGVFLDVNGFELDAPEAELVAAMVAVAEGTWTEADLAAWIREHAVRRPDAPEG